MEAVVRLCAAAVLGTLLVLSLRRESPEQAALLALACGVVLLSLALEPLTEALRCWDRLAARIPGGGELAGPLLKAVGITLIARFAAELCRDSGQSALAAKVELGATAACLAVMMPLLEMTLDLIGSML